MGDAVELWGAQLPVDEVALAAGTIGYELLSRSRRGCRGVIAIAESGQPAGHVGHIQSQSFVTVQRAIFPARQSQAALAFDLVQHFVSGLVQRGEVIGVARVERPPMLMVTVRRSAP